MQKGGFLLFVALFSIGIFLRTYHFHDFLLFEKDQVRDAIFAEQVATGERGFPLLGPTMRASSDDEGALFHIGPAYYYLQIFSAMIFGSRAEAMAYPDVIFSILSLPLFFFFMRMYFRRSTSFILMFLYSISFFIIHYSRFAWNPNLIPFFTLLFLLSAQKFLIEKEKISFLWAGIFGIAFGIGVQLHATILLLFPLVWFFLVLYVAIQRKDIWKKALFIFIIALFLNAPQIVSELQTGFQNTKTMFHFSKKNETSKSLAHKSFGATLADTLSCHIESNVYMLFSLGNEDCQFSFVKIVEKSKSGERFRASASSTSILFMFLFSLFGYGLLLYRFFSETVKRKKESFGLILLFIGTFFCIMLPVVGGSEFREFRYFIPVFFAPFLFVGFFMEYSNSYWKYLIAFLLISMALLGNAHSLSQEASMLYRQEGNDGHAVYYGETEDMVRHIQNRSHFADKVYVMSDRIYTGNIFLPASYIARKVGYQFIRKFSLEDIPKGSPVFFLGKNDGENEELRAGLPVISVKNIGRMRIYELEY